MMRIFQVDVFANNKYSGNGLTVVVGDEELSADVMLQMAKEFRQFETIFLKRVADNKFDARIFTVQEELPFAGHPALGAGAVVHYMYYGASPRNKVIFVLGNREVSVISEQADGKFNVVMNQGQPKYISSISPAWQKEYCKSLNIKEENLCEEYPMETVSTGLPYLIVPIKADIDKVHISCTDFEEKLAANNAKFTYIFDIKTLEGRTWDNTGMLEDAATGSAAGPVCAYMYKHKGHNSIVVSQGRFVGRPSKINAYRNAEGEIFIAGDVFMVAEGKLW